MPSDNIRNELFVAATRSIKVWTCEFVANFAFLPSDVSNTSHTTGLALYPLEFSTAKHSFPVLFTRVKLCHKNLPVYAQLICPRNFFTWHTADRNSVWQCQCVFPTWFTQTITRSTKEEIMMMKSATESSGRRFIYLRPADRQEWRMTWSGIASPSPWDSGRSGAVCNVPPNRPWCQMSVVQCKRFHSLRELGSACFVVWPSVWLCNLPPATKNCQWNAGEAEQHWSWTESRQIKVHQQW